MRQKNDEVMLPTLTGKNANLSNGMARAILAGLGPNGTQQFYDCPLLIELSDSCHRASVKESAY
jgi:hypothetical protein